MALEAEAIYDTDTFVNFVYEASKRIIYNGNTKAVFYMGNTGAGKTTVTQLLHGDLKNLRSVTVELYEYLISDSNNKISSPESIISKTFVPELLQCLEQVSYYDCPGFCDNRSSLHDIAATYFIKKVMTHFDHVKFVFTISYPSLRPGVNRDDFLKLLGNVVTMNKNIQKFDKSIGLIITKVDNHPNKVGDIKGDDDILSSATAFMNNVKMELESKVLKGKNQCKEYYSNAIALIDILARKGKGIL
mgnify:CR=1 FL=1